jgi:hypothetical protein
MRKHVIVTVVLIVAAVIGLSVFAYIRSTINDQRGDT